MSLSSMRLFSLLIILLLCFFPTSSHADTTELPPSATSKALRIITLAPHLTEWVYSLGLGDNLVAVSAYSNYPNQAKSLPQVADFQGADLAAIVALDPTLILAWDGGNKPQDIQRLEGLGFRVFKAKVTEIEDIAKNIQALGALTDTEEKARQLTKTFLLELNALKQQYQNPPYKPVFYYSWTAPLMTIGEDAWPNKLLNVCGATTLFADSPVDYPQVSVQEVLTRQPQRLVAASQQSLAQLEKFWRPHRAYLTAPLIQVDPDVTSRFSLRLLTELKSLCKGIK